MCTTFTCRIPCRPPITYQLVDDVTFCGFYETNFVIYGVSLQAVSNYQPPPPQEQQKQHHQQQQK